MPWNSPIPIQPAAPSVLPPIQDNEEPLVSLHQYSPAIRVYPAYWHQGLSGALEDCFVRQGVAERLQLAASHLPDGYQLVVLDGWRPLEVQQSLYDSFKQQLIEQDWQEGPDLYAELHRFVARPSLDPARPPRHLSGGAVDLTICGPDGWLNMGTSFDDFSEIACTRYFEEHTSMTAEDQKIRSHRRLLYHVMACVGFTNYSDEWWHFDYGNQAWAALSGQKFAQYGGVMQIKRERD